MGNLSGYAFFCYLYGYGFHLVTSSSFWQFSRILCHLLSAWFCNRVHYLLSQFSRCFFFICNRNERTKYPTVCHLHPSSFEALDAASVDWLTRSLSFFHCCYVELATYLPVVIQTCMGLQEWMASVTHYDWRSKINWTKAAHHTHTYTNILALFGYQMKSNRLLFMDDKHIHKIVVKRGHKYRVFCNRNKTHNTKTSRLIRRQYNQTLAPIDRGVFVQLKGTTWQ